MTRVSRGLLLELADGDLDTASCHMAVKGKLPGSATLSQFMGGQTAVSRNNATMWGGSICDSLIVFQHGDT